jgi:hypothetical protein
VSHITKFHLAIGELCECFLCSKQISTAANLRIHLHRHHQKAKISEPTSSAISLKLGPSVVPEIPDFENETNAPSTSINASTNNVPELPSKLSSEPPNHKKSLALLFLKLISFYCFFPTELIYFFREFIYFFHEFFYFFRGFFFLPLKHCFFP